MSRLNWINIVIMQTADKAQEVCDCLNWEVYLATLYSETQDTNNRTPTQKLFANNQLHHFNKNSTETRKTVPGGILDTKKA